MSLTGWLVGLSVLAVVVGVIVWGIRRLRSYVKRFREEIRAVATRHQWDFAQAGDPARLLRYSGFSPFGQGETRRMINLMSGQDDGVHVELFTYQYEVQSGPNDDQTVMDRVRIVSVDMPVAAPGLTITHERVGHKIAQAVGAPDINFESDAFSKRFWVTCRDRKFAYDAITPATMEWMLSGERKDITWQWRGRVLVVSSPGFMKPAECDDLLAYAQGFRKQLPRVILASEGLKTSSPSGTA